LKRNRQTLLLGTVLLTSACESLWGIGDTAPPPRAPLTSEGGTAGAAPEDQPSAGTPPSDATAGGGRGSDDQGGTEAGHEPEAGGESAGTSGADAGQGDGGDGGDDGDDGDHGAGASGAAGSTNVPRVPTSSFGTHPPLQKRPFRVTHPWPSNTFNVCYVLDAETLTPTDAEALVARVHDVLQTGWFRYIGPQKFTLGWWPCSDPRGGSVHLRLSDKDPSRATIGYPGIFETSDITLNTNVSDAEIGYYFGRMLGFEHEYGYDNAPGSCVACGQDQDCGFVNGLSCLMDRFCGYAEDHESIMAAPGCSGIEPTRRLTPWDIFGAQLAYGSKAPGALVNADGYCLNVPNSSLDDATYLVQYPCFGVANDTWSLTRAGEHARLSVVMQGQTRCLAATPSGLAASATCDANEPAQDVELTNLRWRALGGLCVTATSAQRQGTLEVVACGTNPALERWEVRDGQFRLAGTELCATVPSSASAPLALDGCDDEPERQIFQLERGWIVSPSNGCLHVAGGLPIEGSPIGVWPYCGGDLLNEKFFFSGSVQVADRGCLDRAPSWQVGVNACSGTAIQAWDYYW
jgi:Ricin-type beta-trefoil lectin domain